MPTVHRVQAGTLACSVLTVRVQPCALDAAAVQRANIPQSPILPGYTGRRAGVTTKTQAIYAAARTSGFRYPNQFKTPGPGGFWSAKNARNTSR